MAQLRFTTQWHNATRTAMRLTAQPGWTWRDFHAAMRAVTLTLSYAPGPVDLLLDLRDTRLPAGLGAHARAFGKREAASISGRVAVLGVDATARAAANLPPVLTTPHGVVHFLDDEAAAHALLDTWQKSSPPPATPTMPTS